MFHWTIAEAVQAYCTELGVEAVSCAHWANGSAGTEELARKVVALAESGKSQFRQLDEQGYGKFPICMAKTQFSFSTDPNLKGAPSGHVVPIREVRLSAGAEFLVVITGEIMTMPGLPRVPAANSIRLDEDGNVAGLF